MDYRTCFDNVVAKLSDFSCQVLSTSSSMEGIVGPVHFLPFHPAGSANFNLVSVDKMIKSFRSTVGSEVLSMCRSLYCQPEPL